MGKAAIEEIFRDTIAVLEQFRQYEQQMLNMLEHISPMKDRHLGRIRIVKDHIELNAAEIRPTYSAL